MRKKLNSDEIINGIKNNSSQTFKYIHKNIWPKVRNMVITKNGNRDDACDVFQISMMKIFDRIRNNDRIDNFESYMYTTCYHVWMDQLNKKRKQNEFHNEYSYYSEKSFQYDKHEQFIDLMNIFMRLDEKCRKIYNMLADGFDLEEIAINFGCSKRAIITRKSRCKDKYNLLLNIRYRDERY